jgi:hypothetical protein
MTSPRHTASRTLVALVAAVALIGASCGDDGGGGSTEAFCAALEDQEANQELDLDDPEGLAEFNALVDQAPEEVRGAMEEFGQVAQELENLDDNDPEAFGAVFALFGDPDFLRALQELSVFMADECGLEVDGIDEIREMDPDDPGALFGGFAESDGSDGDDAGGSAGGDDPESSTSGDDEPSDTDELGTFIDENHGDTAWADLVVSKAIGTFGDSADVTVSLDVEGAALGEGDALEACEAVGEWAAGFYGGDVTVTITDVGGDELATAADGGPCTAA